MNRRREWTRPHPDKLREERYQKQMRDYKEQQDARERRDQQGDEILAVVHGLMTGTHVIVIDVLAGQRRIWVEAR